jgi:predicted Rossmann fold flavoprotein
MSSHNNFDVIVLGGGAAGLMASAVAGQRGRRVLVLELSNKIGKKILMSGGGRCNFTNLDVSADNFICANPHFVKSALSQYSQWDFIALVSQYEVAYHEKSHGQLFCDESSKDIVRILRSECEKAGVEIRTQVETRTISALDNQAAPRARFAVATSDAELSCNSLIIATGGLSVPTLGGSGFGYEVAKQFGLIVTDTEASLVPFTLTGTHQQIAADLAGVSIPVVITAGGRQFSEALLFTHRGLSGPAVLQASNYWHLGQSIEIDLCPKIDLKDVLLQRKREAPKSTLVSALSGYLPKSMLQRFITAWQPELQSRALTEIKNSKIEAFAEQLKKWRFTPSGTEGYRTAEVTRGGVDVNQLSSKTMEVKHQPGLFFIGEVVDVTGHLGGFNFQWAWSSGYVAGMVA